MHDANVNLYWKRQVLNHFGGVDIIVVVDWNSTDCRALPVNLWNIIKQKSQRQPNTPISSHENPYLSCQQPQLSRVDSRCVLRTVTLPGRWRNPKLVIFTNHFLYSCSLRSWRDSCARGTFLAADPPCEVSGEAARLKSNWLQIDLYTHPSCCSAPNNTALQRLSRQLRSLVFVLDLATLRERETIQFNSILYSHYIRYLHKCT